MFVDGLGHAFGTMIILGLFWLFEPVPFLLKVLSSLFLANSSLIVSSSHLNPDQINYAK
jgi:hypothetical protein